MHYILRNAITFEESQLPLNKQLPMKRLIIIAIAIICILATSCENKWPVNGYLDGMWQVMEIKHDGEWVYKYDENNPPANRNIYYVSIQLKLFELSNRGMPHMYYGYFNREGERIRFYQTSYYSSNESNKDDNVLIPDSMINTTIKPWGLNKTDESFNIVTLSDDDWVLENASTTIVLRKF